MHEGVSFTLMLHEGLGLWGWWCTRDIAQGVGSVSHSCCTTALHVGWGLWVGGARGHRTRAVGISRRCCTRSLQAGLWVGVARGRCTRMVQGFRESTGCFTGASHEAVERGTVGGRCTTICTRDLGGGFRNSFIEGLCNALHEGVARGRCTRAIIGDAAFMGGVPSPI